MSKSYSFVEVREHLADLIAQAQAGEQAIVTRYGKQVAVIGPVAGGESHTVHVAPGESVTLSLNLRPLMLDPGVRELVFDVIEAFKRLEAGLDSHDTTQKEVGHE